MRGANTMLPGKLLDAAEAVVVRQGISNLTLDAVAAEAGMSKGGLLHHFRTKDRLVEALVVRSAENWRACCLEAYGRTPEGPGRMARALLSYCLSDAQGWTDQLRHSSSAVFAALAQNPSLIYSDLHRRIAEDGLPPGVGEAIAAAIVLPKTTLPKTKVLTAKRVDRRSQPARSQPWRYQPRPAPHRADLPADRAGRLAIDASRAAA